MSVIPKSAHITNIITQPFLAYIGADFIDFKAGQLEDFFTTDKDTDMLRLLMIALVFFITNNALAGFPDSITVKGTKLVKNGEGPRKYLSIIGRVNVYTAVLYLEKKTVRSGKNSWSAWH